MEQVSTNGVTHTTNKSEVKFGMIRVNPEYQKAGTKTLEVRQTVTTVSKYPSARVSNNLQSNIFATEEFGFENQEYVSKEERVAWILVPEAATEEAIKAKLEAANKAGGTLYRVLSNEPILSDDQLYAINQGLRTKDQFAERQVLRYPDNETTRAEGTANKIILDVHGNVQYRRVYFWHEPKADMDLRDPNKVYTSPAIAQEVADLKLQNIILENGASLMQGQTV